MLPAIILDAIEYADGPDHKDEAYELKVIRKNGVQSQCVVGHDRSGAVLSVIDRRDPWKTHPVFYGAKEISRVEVIFLEVA